MLERMGEPTTTETQDLVDKSHEQSLGSTESPRESVDKEKKVAGKGLKGLKLLSIVEKIRDQKAPNSHDHNENESLEDKSVEDQAQVSREENTKGAAPVNDTLVNHVRDSKVNEETSKGSEDTVEEPIVQILPKELDTESPGAQIIPEKSKNETPVVQIIPEEPDSETPVVQVTPEEPDLETPIVRIVSENPDNEKLVVHVVPEKPDNKTALVEITPEEPNIETPIIQIVPENPDIERSVVQILPEGSDAENFDQTFDNIEAGEKESPDEGDLPEFVECTACGTRMKPLKRRLCRHPVLGVIVCKKCNKFYNSSPFTRDEYGVEEYCKWCADGGKLICCDFCEKSYCKPCLRRNLGKEFLKALMSAESNLKWKCFVCDPTQVEAYKKECDLVMKILEKLKLKEFIFENKKTHLGGPSQLQRKERLVNIVGCIEEGVDLPKSMSPNKDFVAKVSSVGESRQLNSQQKSKKNSEIIEIVLDDESREGSLFSNKTEDRSICVDKAKGDKGIGEADSKSPDFVGTKSIEELSDAVNVIYVKNKKPEIVELSDDDDEVTENDLEHRVAVEPVKINSPRPENKQGLSKVSHQATESDSSEIAFTEVIFAPETHQDILKDFTIELERIEIPERLKKKKSAEQVILFSSDENRAIKDEKEESSDSETSEIERGLEDVVSKIEQPSPESRRSARESSPKKGSKKVWQLRIRPSDHKNKKGKKSDKEASSSESKSERSDQSSAEESASSDGHIDLEQVKNRSIRQKEISSDDSDMNLDQIRNRSVQQKQMNSTEKELKNKRKSTKPKRSVKIEETDSEGSIKIEQDIDEIVEETLAEDDPYKLDEEDGMDEALDDSENERHQRQTRRRSKRKRKGAGGDDTSETESGADTKKTKRRRRGRVVSLASSSDESEVENGKGKKKGKAKGKGKGKGKQGRGRKGKRRKGESSEEISDDDDEDASPSKRKGRKKIRRILADDELTEETQRARQLEEDRRKRLLERTQTREEIEAELERANAFVLEKDKKTGRALVEVHPSLVEHLKPHQKEGVQFLYDAVVESVESWKKGNSGGALLAHCMGLGKTLQIISFVHTLYKNEETNLRNILVVAPLNTVLNWQVEFEKWLEVDERLDVYCLTDAGGNMWRRVDMLQDWMTYGGVMILGYEMYRNLSLLNRIRSKKQKRIITESLVDPGPELVICDEGHVLRNDQSAISKQLNKIKTKRRVVLTGTPLQNNLNEYHVMVSFIKPNLLGTRKEFQNRFINPISNGQCSNSTPADVMIMKQRCHVLHELLSGCVQRKDYSVLTPFLTPKHEFTILVRLCDKQIKMYRHYLETFVYKNTDDIKTRDFYKDSLARPFVQKYSQVLHFHQTVQTIPIKNLKSTKLYCMSLFSDYQCLMRIWTHPWALKVDAIRKLERNKYGDDSLDEFINDESDADVSGAEEGGELPDWKGGSDSSDFTSKNIKKKGAKKRKISESSMSESSDSSSEKANMLDSSTSSDEATARPTRNTRSTVRTETAKNKKVIKENMAKRRVASMVLLNESDFSDVGDDVKPKIAKKEATGDVVVVQPQVERGLGNTRSGTSYKESSANPDKSDDEDKEWYDSFLDPDDEYNIELSGKMVLLLEILADAEVVGDKVLVFSQSLVSLDLIERALGGGKIGGNEVNWCKGVDYFRMDGSTAAQTRQRYSEIFNDPDNDTARLFLISTRAGSLGINMVAANRVIIFDCSWNPSHDVQSVFRVYRFGQIKPCYVYRFISQGTMEEKIYDRQITKLAMAGRVVDEQQIERHFTEEEIRELYIFKPDEYNDKEERPTPQLPKDPVLAEVLQRLHQKWIVKYHEHDLLLENIEEEQLTEEERKQAWANYEAEKDSASRMLAKNQQDQERREKLIAEYRRLTELQQEQQRIRQQQVLQALIEQQQQQIAMARLAQQRQQQGAPGPASYQGFRQNIIRPPMNPLAGFSAAAAQNQAAIQNQVRHMQLNAARPSLNPLEQRTFNRIFGANYPPSAGPTTTAANGPSAPVRPRLDTKVNLIRIPAANMNIRLPPNVRFPRMATQAPPRS